MNLRKTLSLVAAATTATLLFAVPALARADARVWTNGITYLAWVGDYTYDECTSDSCLVLDICGTEFTVSGGPDVVEYYNRGLKVSVYYVDEDDNYLEYCVLNDD